MEFLQFQNMLQRYKDKEVSQGILVNMLENLFKQKENSQELLSELLKFSRNKK